MFHQGLLNAGLRQEFPQKASHIVAVKGVVFHQGLLNAGLRLEFIF